MIKLENRHEELLEKIKTIPEKPGIYQIKDRDGDIIYIGKSKSLKTRIRSYFNADPTNKKIQQMMFHIYDIDTILTDTHLEAQILECALIKKVKPIYNKQFKNDKKYVYLKVGRNISRKLISIVNDRLDKYCIGPFRGKNRLIDTINLFRNIYPITKSNFKYEFKYNALPLPMEKKIFEKNRECLLEIFFNEGNMKLFMSQVEKKMEDAALEHKYEMASKYRDLIEGLKYIYSNYLMKGKEFEGRKILMGERIDKGYKLFFVFDYQIILKRKYCEINKEIIESFLKRGRELIKKRVKTLDEKRQLDFKRIIISEINDRNSKVVEFVDRKFSADSFINSLERGVI